MKNKIRRAFDLTKPNVLTQVLEDCPAPENAPATKPKRKPLSDRTMRFISVAASFAILISAVGGGFVYFRDYFVGQGFHAQSTGNHQGTPEPGETVPLHSGMMISEEDAKKIALEYAQGSMGACMVVSCKLVDNAYYKVGISGEILMWFTEVYVDAYSGEIIDPIIPADTISEENAKEIAIKYATELHGDCVVVSCEFIFRSGLNSYYQVGISGAVAEWYTSVCVDAFTGEIMEGNIPSGRTLTMTGARDIALGMRGHYVDYLRCLKISENSDFYTVYYEQGEYAYELHVDSDGNVLYDSGEQHIGLRADQQMSHLIGWEKARSIALNACGRDVSELIGFTYEYCPGDPDYYHLELYFEDDAFTYRIGALGGELLEGTTSPITLDFSVSEGPSHTSISNILSNYENGLRLILITSVDELTALHKESGHEAPAQYGEDFFKENALLIVDYYHGSSPYQIGITDIQIDAQGNYTVSVACYTTQWGDCMVVEGSLLVEVHQPIKPSAQVDLTVQQCSEQEWNDLFSSSGLISVEKATEIAMAYTGHTEDYAAGTVTDLACKFDEQGNPAAYYIYFQVGSESFEVGIDAATGTVLFCNGYATDKQDLYPKEDAIQAALAYSNVPDGKYPVIECYQIGTEPGRIIYMVICRGNATLTTMVDANTLRIMDHGMSSFPETALTRQDARAIAYKACNLEEEGPMCTEMIGMFNDGVQFYCAKVYWDEMVYVVVMDANTGEVLAQTEFANTRIPGLILSEEHALEYALANAFVSLADAEDPTVVHDADSQTFTVTFRYQGDLCTVIVDDYYGSVIDMYWIVDE